MATISYTTFFNPIENMKSRIGDEWMKLEELEEQYSMAHAEYNKLLSDLHYAKMNMTIIDNEICKTQDAINELTIECEDLSTSTEGDYEVHDLENTDDEWEDDDIDVSIKERKTRRDILSVGQAVKSKKSSKNHKLKPRSVKRDRTKMPENKTHSKCVKMSHAAH